MKKKFILSVFCISFILFSPLHSFSQNVTNRVVNQIIYQYDCEEDLIEVLFIPESEVRLRDGQLTDLATDALLGLDNVLYDLEWTVWNRISDVPESEMDQWAVNGEKNTGQPIYNMNNIYRLQIPKGKDIWQLCEELKKLDGIMSAIPVPKPMPLPTPPNYQSQQGYLNPAVSTPTGIDAAYAWTQTGGIGTGVTVCDLEYSWNYNHADISKGAGSSLNSWTDPGWGNDHGTAVIGELVSDNNGWGTTGICYGANLKTCGTYYGSPSPYWNVAGAIGLAVSSLSAGDIILLEQQWDYTGSNGYVPIEWWGSTNVPQTNNSVYIAIVNAISNGIHVVEAGGNGNVNTGSLSWYGNSGAIIVGAGGASVGNDLQRLSFSSYGTRFDLQGWGENVCTTGYGNYYSSEGVNYYYTNNFNGTSSASPVVTGALACAEGYYLVNVSTTPPTPAYMRTHLATYGTSQIIGTSGNIGPRPDLYSAISNFPPPQQISDWGDAIDPPYPTLSSSTGASHIIVAGMMLGASIDPENNGQPNYGATGDDNDGNNDDDGVVFNNVLRPGSIIGVTVVASVPGVLNAWIDFNGTNAWADAGEQIFFNTVLSAGTNNLTFTVPAYSIMGNTYARFRFSSQQGVMYSGQAPDGEVEDYMVFIDEPINQDVDWGDAPDGPYPTFAATNGANHLIDGVTFLGNQVDGEPDGQPDGMALGDDNDLFYPPPFDDEDGVMFTSPNIPGQTATVDVIASVGGFLNVWYDFDMNGSWADPGEHVFIDFLLNPGLNNLAFQVPPTAIPGQTFARFRFDTNGGLNFDGPAQNGEVEDYEIYIEEGQGGIKWEQLPDLSPTGMDVDATWQPDNPEIPPLILADDFLCTETGYITDIHIWGSWINDHMPYYEVPEAVEFTFSLHADIPAGELEPWSMPGEVLWVKTWTPTWEDVEWIYSGVEDWYNPFLPEWLNDNHEMCIKYNCYLDSADYFLQEGTPEEPIIYWLDVQAAPLDSDIDCRFGWKTSLDHWNDDAVWTEGNEPYNGLWQELRYPLGHEFETESVDLAFAITTQEIPMDELDFGDASDPIYPTLLASNGANHLIDGITFLGSSVDPDPDGQPDPNALGDDNDGNDDEDGVVFTSSLIQGQTVTVDVVASVSGILNAWMDFDANGSWADSGEQIFVDIPLSPGVNNLLFSIPASASTGSTFARFRFSTQSGLSYTGQAQNGEVEDYAVEIGIENLLKWEQYPDLTTNGIDVFATADMYEQDPPIILADDFLCTETGNITDIHIWGSWLDDIFPYGNMPDQVQFTLSIHADIPADESPTGYSMPGETLWLRQFDSGSFDIEWYNQGEEGWLWPYNDDPVNYQFPGDTWCIKYNFYLSPEDYFYQQGTEEEPIVYWLDVQAVPQDPNAESARFGWKTSVDHWNDNAVWTFGYEPYNGDWYELVYPLGHEYETQPIDLAFQITTDGEQPDEFDFGDANDPPYPTLSGSNGASHVIDGLTFLGVSVDADPDGQPDPNALGDDNDGNDDEDGVTFDWPLSVGNPCKLTVNASVSNGLLNGWIDFDGNGSWADPGEQVFTDIPLMAGDNSLNFMIPTSVPAGLLTYARFRFSTQPGLNFDGPAPDGEVEDYEVEIVEFEDYKWAQYPDINLPGLHANDYVNVGGGIENIVIADDWFCNGGLVTDIHWWGNYELNLNGQEDRGSGIDHFHLSIHMQSGAGCLPLDPEVWGVDVPFSSLVEQNTGLINNEGCPVYLYEYILNIPFEQDAGNSYWVDISAFSADPNMPALWRWQESMRSYYPILCGAADKLDPGILPWSTIQWLPNPPHKYSDMAFIITSQEIESMDFGDANDPTYPTLLINDGARHIIDGVTFMGSLIDQEPTGQPDPNALGDDNDGNDDEDGVFFYTALVQGQTSSVDIDVSVDGYLNAWIDFNGNGSWADWGEQIATDVLLVAGMNTVTFNVPLIATVGTTYARFRFSSSTGLSYTGIAPDGEVEDYEVIIEEIPNKWAQYPDPNLPGLHAHDYDLPPYEQIILADDWVCEGGWVTDIHWWGNYELDPFGQEIRGSGIEYFHLSIHTYDAATCLPQDPEIWGIDIPFSTLVELNTGLVNLEGCNIYQYEFFLDEPFPQVQGTHYWLDITAFCSDPLDPAHWRWQESGRTTLPILCGASEKTIPLPGIWNTITWINNRFSDMAFLLTSEPAPELDMGDAADPTYPTLLANNGAAHIIDYTVYLGNSIDPDTDGQPDPLALGDDNDGNDDEDGVSVLFPLIVGGGGGVGIIASAAGTVNAWFDFNQNGNWTEADEHILIDAPVNPGGNMLFFSIPNNAIIGKTIARFRYSTSSGLSYTGLAPDGEVEDYEFLIEGEADVYLNVFLEGPYNGTGMDPHLNTSGVIPLNQPYDSDATAIWYYTGTESVSSIPGVNIIDWVEVEFRDAPSAPLATPATTVNTQAAFLLSDGSIVGLDGTGPLKVYGIYTHNLYAVIWHRNHLGILSANPLVPSGINQYSYDFTTGPGQAYLGGQVHLGGGIYGMYGADGTPDGFIDGLDKSIWTLEAGNTGYNPADYNLDTQVDNKDKNDFWIPNIGKGTQVP